MNTAQKTLVSVQNFARRHKVAIAVTATAVPLLALVVRNQRQFNEFLEEKDLLNEFYELDEI